MIIPRKFEFGPELSARIAAVPDERARNPELRSGRTGESSLSTLDDYEAPAADARRLVELARGLYKRRHVAVTVFMLVFCAVILHTFSATSIYEARAQILIETETPNVVAFEEVLEQHKATMDYYQTQYRLLRSRELARRTLESAKLWPHSEFTRRTTDTRVVRDALAIAVRKGRALFGVPKPPPAPTPAPAPDANADRAHAIDMFLVNLSVAPVRNSRLVDVSYSSADPKLAAAAVNALASAYIQQALEFKFLATKEAAEFLSREMSSQRKAVETTELALQHYREQNDAVSLEDRQNIVVQRLADLNAAVTKARTERIERESIYNQIPPVRDRIGLDSVPAIISNPFIQQLKGELADLQRQQAQLSDKLGERHPEMIRVRAGIRTSEAKLQAEVQKVVKALRTEYLAARERERSLTAALNEQKAEALALNRRAIDYGVLQRDAAMNRQLYEGLLQRTKETTIAGELKTSNIRVVDAAEVPRVPSRPQRARNLLLGLFGGISMGILAAFIFERLDDRVRTPEDVRTRLGLPFLGMVPALPGKTNKRSLLITGGAPANFVEAFRGIRTSLLFASAEPGPKSVLVTSTAPSEGKTLVCQNLAVALAQGGLRVLLVDADLRRPALHDAFAIPREPGLSNVIAGNLRPADCMKRISQSTLWVLPGGKRPPNPPELLGSRRFAEFMAALSEHFDWVIIDSPPVMAVTDPVVLSRSVTGVVFVVGAEMTATDATKEALAHLSSAKPTYFGAILNRVQLERHAYYYARYYRREYAAHYSASRR